MTILVVIFAALVLTGAFGEVSLEPVADAGVLELARRCCPALPVHLSTQASVTNAGAARFWLEQGLQRIIAARDPLGIKPLYVAQLDEGLAFCSELKAFDGLGLTEIKAIGPGEMFDSLDGTRRWFRISHGAAEAEPGLDIESVCRELRLTLEDAVRKWMVADVEVGPEDDRTITRFNGQPALGISITNAAGVNVVTVGRAIDVATAAPAGPVQRRASSSARSARTRSSSRPT